MADKKLESLKMKILEAREKIQSVGSYGDFHAHVKDIKGQRSGFSNSNISNLLKAIESKKKKTDDELANYEYKVEQFYSLAEKFAQSKKSNISNFYGTVWEVYFFYGLYKSDTGLGRAGLEIDEDGRVHLDNVKEDGVSTDYEGSFSLIDDNVLFLDLRGEAQGRKIHIKVMTGTSPGELALGAYTSYEKQKVVSGTIVFKKYGGKLEDIDIGIFAYSKNYDKFSKIDIEIRKFLSSKKENFIKLPNHINDIRNLGKFMNEYRTNKKRLFFNSDKPILYFSSPMYFAEENYKRSSKIVSEIANDLDKGFENDNLNIQVKDPGKYIEGERRNARLAKNQIIENIEALKGTKFFVMIFDSNEPTLSFVELGIALVQCKHVLVFYTDKKTFPSMLPHLNTSKRLNYFACHYIDSLEANRDFIFDTIDLEVRDNLGREDED